MKKRVKNISINNIGKIIVDFLSDKEKKYNISSKHIPKRYSGKKGDIISNQSETPN